MIRLGHTEDTYFSAGDEHLSGDGQSPPPWPPAGPPPEGWWYPPPVPTLDEVREVAAQFASGSISASDAHAWAEDRLALLPELGEQGREDELAGETYRELVELEHLTRR
jgi:hypothetical protein